MGAALVLYASALNNSGNFNYEWLSSPDFAEGLQIISIETLRSVIGKNFTATVDQLKAMQRDADSKAKVQSLEYRRFSYNPLWGRPVISDLTENMLIPVPGLLIRQASPLGVYYSGVREWGNRFAEDAGDLFEAYVGRNLKLIPDAKVHPEISYGSKRGNLSVDWFAVFRDCVILIEVKSVRPTEPVRTANAGAGDDLKRMLGYPIDQINKSSALILNRNEHFEKIPAHLPLLGLIITMEPFYTSNFPHTKISLPDCDIPYRICSISELEELVVVDDQSVGDLLLKFLTDESKEGWPINGAIKGHAGRRNAVIDEAWSQNPWQRSAELTE